MHEIWLWWFERCEQMAGTMVEAGDVTESSIDTLIRILDASKAEKN